MTRTYRAKRLLGFASMLALAAPAMAQEPVRTTTTEIVRSPAEFDRKPVALGGCQLGQLPEGPACWVLDKGRNLGVIRLEGLPNGMADQIEETCPRAGIGNGQACLVRVFGWVETGSQAGTTLKGAMIKWPD